MQVVSLPIQLFKTRSVLIFSQIYGCEFFLDPFFSGNRNYSQSLYGYLYRRIRVIFFIFFSSFEQPPRCFVLCLFKPTLANTYPPHLFFFFFCFVGILLFNTCFGQGRLTCVHLLSPPICNTLLQGCLSHRIIYLFILFFFCYPNRSASFFIYNKSCF